MSTSAVAICNLALARIGNGQAIAALTEQSAAAVQLNAIYEPARDDLLRAFAWGFAKRVATLALVASNPTPDWAYSYQVPADCLMARRILSQTGRTTPTAIPFEIIGSDTGALLLADVAAPYLEYTARTTSEGLFTPDFVSLFAWRLAADAAVALAVNPAFADRAQNGYQAALSHARRAVRQERQDDTPPESSFVTART